MLTAERMTADSMEGDKKHSESSVTQNCSFQGFIVTQEYICNEEKAFPIFPLSFQIISAALSPFAVKHRLSELERRSVIIEFNILISRTIATRP